VKLVLRLRPLLIAVALSAAGCASGGNRGVEPPPDAGTVAAAPAADAATAEPAAPPAGEPTEAETLGPGESGAVEPSPPQPSTPRKMVEELTERKSPCAEPAADEEQMIDAARRRLYQTVCGAALWFDSLFGEQSHVAAAKNAYGRLELSAIDSQYWGFKERIRFDVRVRFPNIDERLDAFVGRDNEEEFVEGRSEGFALRSQFRNFEREDRWVAGLGYGLPGSYAKRTDFRIGGKGGREPEVFAQGRHRRNWFLGDRALLHFRQVLFWTNRDDFGATISLDFDRVVTSDLLFRWANIGTWSETTEGLDWRVAGIFYQNLGEQRAIAYEAYARGETDEVVPLREYGLRTIFRKPIRGREWLYGEIILGYGWVRELLTEPREGSYSVGFGVELLFGRENYY
jgi:hypothetical protein